MRIVGGEPPHVDWFIWDCEGCFMPRQVCMVDDELNVYEQAVLPMHVVNDRVVTRIVRCRKILIYADRFLILVNPIEEGAKNAADSFVRAVCGEPA